MSILYPSFLWLFLPLAILFFYRPKHLTDTVHLFSLALILIALSRPVIDQGPQERQIEANEVIIALDVSYSMKAEDIAPNRYEFSTQTIESFLKQNISDNITLIAFTTNPLLLSPPTTDHQLISLSLKSLRLDNILTKGTSLEKLLKKVASLPMDEKNLILITDGGEEKESAILNSIIRNNGINPIILAMGTTAGATIPNDDGTMLKDDEGNLVVSRINPLLEEIASQNNGIYQTPSHSPEATAANLQDALDSFHAEKHHLSKMSHSYIELYPIPLFIAAILFLLVHTRGIKYLIIFATIFGTQAEASFLDLMRLDSAYVAYNTKDYNRSKVLLGSISNPSLQSQIALGHTHYRLGEYEEAIRYYKSINSTSPEVKQSLFYNIGNAYAKLGLYDKSRRYYTKALQLGEDEDTRYNLNLIVLLEEKKAQKGLTNPNPQGSSGTKTEQSESKESDSEQKDEASSSGSGSGGSEEGTKSKEEMKLIEDKQNQEQPLSSKVYEMINKGYIHEKQPW